MKAGRELDALVAEKVMGWQWMRQEAGHRYGDGTILAENKVRAYLYRPMKKERAEWSELIPDDGKYPRGKNNFIDNYSTDIAVAWQVVEHLLGAHEHNTFELEYGFGDDQDWCASFGCSESDDKDGVVTIELADTGPLAICLAALKARGVQKL